MLGVQILRFNGLCTPECTEWITKVESGARTDLHTPEQVVVAFMREAMQVPEEFIGKASKRMIESYTHATDEVAIKQSKKDPLEYQSILGSAKSPHRRLLVEMLGKGGRGATYLTYDWMSGRAAAGKVSAEFLNEGDAATQKRREADWLNAAKVTQRVFPEYTYGKTTSQQGEVLAYSEMPYFEGVSMGDLISKRHEGLTQKETIGLIALIAHFFAKHVHGKNVVHRDVKPDNIMLSKFGTIGVIDYDLAKCTEWPDSPHDKEGARGTAAYMSGEQALRFDMANEQSDIYSFAASVIHLVTGTPPFSGKGMGEAQLLMAHMIGRKLDAHKKQLLEERLGKPAAALILKCFSRNPDERCQSMTEIGEELWKLLPPQEKFKTFKELVDGVDRPGSPEIGKIVRSMLEAKHANAETESDAKVPNVQIDLQKRAVQADVQEIVGLA